MKKRYDIGVIGFWYGANYGSILNGYATYKILKSFGCSPLMINKPNAAPDDRELNDTHNARFVRKFYDKDDVSPCYSYERMHELNQLCDGFCTGSDQTFNYNLSFNMSTFLNFAADNKRKISFAASFGHADDKTPQDKKEEIGNLLRRYDAISVREQSGVKICQSYGVKADEVLEPVFCIDESNYINLAEQSKFNESEPYILTYILDPTPAKRKAILFYAEKLGFKSVNILDGVSSKFDKNKAILDLPNILNDVHAEDFIKAYMNASFVITDSFHGSAFAIMFNKPFISINNFSRGATRFGELLGKFNLMHRLIPDPANIPEDEKYLESVNFAHANDVILTERKRTIDWLKNAVEISPPPMTVVPRVNEVSDENKEESTRIKKELNNVKMELNSTKHQLFCLYQAIGRTFIPLENEQVFFVSRAIQETKINEYLNILAELARDFLVIIAVKDTPGNCINNYVVEKLQSIGFKEDLQSKLWRSYIGVIDSGRLLYENLSKDNEPSLWKIDLDGLQIDIASMAWNNGNVAIIKINGIDYAVNERGLNIVIFDKNTRCFIDSVCFDAHHPDFTCSRGYGEKWLEWFNVRINAYKRWESNKLNS